MEMDSKQLFYQMMQDFTLLEERGEKESIVYWVLEDVFHLSRTEIMAGKSVNLDKLKLNNILHRLNRHEPIQYILGHTEFCGRPFSVNPSVLIPRPETEQLVSLVAEYLANLKRPSVVIDIGTGSGCIAITLALDCPSADVFATDISEGALTTAKKNAEQLDAKINFIAHDIIRDELSRGPFDVVVSNPPYIPLIEKNTLQKNVSEYEPSLALFVPDSNPLYFHEAIVKKASQALKVGGMLITEIHESLGYETAALFQSNGFTQIKIIKDFSEKNRFVKGIK
jgi:release factor glutamine methyltransferase